MGAYEGLLGTKHFAATADGMPLPPGITLALLAIVVGTTACVLVDNLGERLAVSRELGRRSVGVFYTALVSGTLVAVGSAGTTAAGTGTRASSAGDLILALLLGVAGIVIADHRHKGTPEVVAEAERIVERRNERKRARMERRNLRAA